MPFGLCNAPATFQRCMFSIFSEYIENIIEVFMDDFSVYGSSFDDCLKKLTLILKRCIETNLVLNWKKCHFMINQGIVLEHVISNKGLEVDKAKIDICVFYHLPLLWERVVLLLDMQVFIGGSSRTSQRYLGHFVAYSKKKYLSNLMRIAWRILRS